MPTEVEKKREVVWAVNPHGITVAVTMKQWNWPGASGQQGWKYKFGWRLATKEEIAEQLGESAKVNQEIADSEVVKMRIVDAPKEVKVEVPDQEMSWKDMKAAAKKQGISTWGKNKSQLTELLGL